ncbi:MAG: aminodeoxychorismate lyase, partial [Bacteroidetes bacterium]|nr:aminodeoxychorismate lyase [Bacteroidota bacterium]
LEREGQKRRLFNVDYDIVHPYNTYLIDGLPPGPVTNPSKSSIRAVLNAEDHKYMFFVAKGDGSHTFSRTLREHNRAAREFHRLMRERRREAADG